MTARNFCRRAISASGVPVSVMAMNWSGRARAAKYRQNASVSIVLPDLLEMTKSVRARSGPCPAARTASGLVLSKTCRLLPPNVSASTSAARLEPPMPQTRVRQRPTARTAAPRAGWACFASSRWVSTSEQRRAWRWIGAGCASFFTGQLVWNYYDLIRGAPPYPSLADVGFLGLYACLIAGLVTLVRGQPARRTDPELVLDTVLVTFTVGALAYEYLLEPLLTAGAPVSAAALVTSIGWSIGAVTVLWMILMQMLRRPVFPAATAALLLPAVIAFVIGDQVYAVVALRGTYQAGGSLDLTWDVGLLLIAAAAAVAPDYAQHLQRGRSPTTEIGRASCRERASNQARAVA